MPLFADSSTLITGSTTPHHSLKPGHAGTSLVVQWLRHRTPSAGGLGSIPGQGTRLHMPQLKSLHATTKALHATKEFACLNKRPCMLQVCMP